MPPSTLICPHCHQEIAIEEALTHQVSETLEREFKEKILQKEKELEMQGKVQLKTQEERLAKELHAQAQQKVEQQLKLLEEQNIQKEKQLEEARKNELEIRRLMNKLEDDKKAFELEKQRQLDEERGKIRQTIEQQMSEQQRVKDLEKEKIIADLKKSLDDAKRKAEQGSQQTQGEVIELELEELLRSSFPTDTIEPIGKGVHGADIRQIVRSPRGVTCGTILWESKQTKRFEEKWIGKLKEDLRNEKADIPALVTAAYIDDAWKGIVHHDGVWVCSFALFIPLAMLLRKTLLDVGYQKAVSLHRGEKADLLYEYITGHEFRQQIEALVEVFSEMSEQVQRERVAFEKSWKQREAHVKRLYMSTAHIFGSIQGLAGSSAIPELKGLDLLDSGEVN
ncbi:hypothetical protein C5B42_03100 [Candidatus Cerribacteria bacterium 'Amazon FNV 2010 28 9']|uniref:DUF2130 domain-containing protein n=1 Tax=Candidatus Cerribacteria bacterium 'Amazon FNV 2010 28 9' TaxID=2081795 RepID=A0A317JTU6_9BACT|nr:MAG: hypothetical protein C5B42_03100 [Candidatus Cerribacteria bacterium 'Amazon FNV 2010 28 9']